MCSTTVIISTGGVEPNGPWLATGKHNYVLRANCNAIARKLGDALCAPIVAFVPEGGHEPPSGHMRSPGTINAGQSWSYNIPARPGDTITLQARALDKFIKKDRLFVVHDNVFFNQHDEVICSGRGWTIRPA